MSAQGLAALRAVAGRQAKDLDENEINQRLERIAGRDRGADKAAHDAEADEIRDRLKQVLWRDKPDPRHGQQRKQEERARAPAESESEV
jgi:Rad3-related DNA helicase